MDLTKEITIPITMSAHEWCRLYHMANHVSEEAHDNADSGEPWHREEWWNEFAARIEKNLNEHEITKCDMHAYNKSDLVPETKIWGSFEYNANGVRKRVPKES